MNKLGKVAVALAMAFSVGAAFGYTSALYVQDGLVHQWDGIENAGVGLSDTTTSVWVDLKGDADLTLKDEKSQFTGNALTRSVLNYAYAKADTAITGVKTVEVTFRRAAYQKYAVIVSLEGYKDNGRGLLTMKDDGLGSTYHGYHDSYDATHCEFVTVALYADVAKGADNLFVDGVALPSTTVSEGWSSGMANEFTLGGRWSSSSGNCFSGEIFSCRLYDRYLSSEELVKNAKVDAIRFNGASGGDALTVKGTPEDYGEVSPAYGTTNGLTAGDGLPCVAMKVWTNKTETVAANCVGYKVLVDGVVSEEKTFGEADEAAFDYVHPDCIVGAELVWRWTTKYRVQAETIGGGTVEVSGDGWFAPGETATVTAVPPEGKSFVKWTGEGVDPARVKENPYAFAVGAAPVKLTACFAGTLCVAPYGDDANSGANWDHPLATLAGALEVANDDDKIVFDDGVYSNLDITVTTTIDRPLTITSRNGRDKTTLYFTFGANVRALELKDKDAVMSGLTLASNRSTSYGAGALSITAGRFADGAIIGFSCARAWSEGVAANLSGGTICNTVMSNNLTHTSGASTQFGTLVLAKGEAVADRCTIVDNEVSDTTVSTDKHGAVYVAGGTSLRNSLVARNKKPSKNSGVSVAKNGVVDNCTIVGNTCGSTTEFGGVYAASGAIIRNTIIAGNTNQAGERNFTLLDPGASLSNCCSPDDISAYGEGNKVTVPEFVDAASGDYHLAAGPCINGGEPLDWMDDKSLDLDDRPRIIGAKPDIGCYEKVAGKLTVSAVASATYGVGELSVDFTASVDGADLAGLSYKWYLSGRDEPDFSGADKESVHWDYLAPGSYTVRIEASNAAGEKAAATYEDMITVAPSVVYVSKTSTPKKPYASWETAANTIEDVMTVVGAGVTVIVGDGEYPISSVIMLDKNITLVSANGPGRTTLQPGKSGNFQLVNLSDPEALLSGFTLRDSVSQAVGMVGGGTVSNCVFRNNKSDASTADNGGAGAFVSGTGNVITHCVFSNNTISVAGGSFRHGAAVCVADSADCAIDNCLFVQNALGVGTVVKYGSAVRFGSGSKGRVRNCLFLKNSATGTDTRGALALVGSGAVDVENCTFVGNSTSGGDCAGFYANGNANIANCLFAGNTNASGVSNVWLGASATVTTCRETDDLKDFKRPSRGNYHLKGCSPALNAGTDAEWMKTATDLEGNPRIRQRAVDIGCYEDLETGFSILVR